MRRFPIPVILIALMVAAVLAVPPTARAADHHEAPIVHSEPQPTSNVRSTRRLPTQMQPRRGCSPTGHLTPPRPTTPPICPRTERSRA